MFICWYNVNWMFDSLLRSCIITLAWAFVGLASKNLMSPSDCFCCEIIERFHPSANNRPSEILTTCLHCLLIVSLCVTIKMVIPVSLNLLNTPMSCSAVLLSSDPVGSSARIKGARIVNAKQTENDHYQCSFFAFDQMEYAVFQEPNSLHLPPPQEGEQDRSPAPPGFLMRTYPFCHETVVQRHSMVTVMNSNRNVLRMGNLLSI